MTRPSPAPETVANPFVGPRPLEKGQSIFGRDPEIDQLYYLLSAERIVLFHSPSGAGKSSLLQAGLVPRLALQFDVWTPARVNLPPPADLAAGVNRYVRSCNLAFEAEVPGHLQRPEEVLSAMTLSDFFASRPRRRSAPKNTVLIFDQFEEVLTVDPLALDARREFFVQLGRLLQNPQIWAVFVLREDYLAQLDPYAGELPTHLKNRFRLDLLSREAAAETIAKSVEAAGRSFAPSALRRLVTDLAMMQVQQPSGEFRNEPGPYIEPLHLQVTCRGLWDRMPAARTVIENDDVTSFGSVTAALSAYYRSEVAGIAAGDEQVERSIRRWFGEKLIARGSIRGQVLREAGKSGGLANPIVARLIDSHLVRAETRASATWYELAHDRLVEPVLRDNEHWLAAHLSVAQQRALQWEREGEPESLLLTGAELTTALRWAARRGGELTPGESRFLAAARRKRRRLVQARAAVAVLLALLIAALLLAFVARREVLVARRERDRAERNLSLAKQAVDETLSSAGRQQAQEFADPPGMEAFRRELLAKAGVFYSAFTHQEHDNPQLLQEAAQGHSRLGDVNRLLNRPSQAIAQYNAAISGFQSLAARYPRAPQYRQALGYCHNWMGETLRAEFEHASAPNPALAAQAEKQYDAALRLQQQLHTATPQNRQYTQEWARTDYNRGILAHDRGDDRAAESDFRVAIALLQPIAALPAAAQDAPAPAQDLGRVENNLASLLADQGRNKEARPLYEQAILIAKRLSDAQPDNREYRAELAKYCDNEARLLVDMNQLTAAAARNRQALVLVQTLADPGPSLSMEQIDILQQRSAILLAQGSKDALEESETERKLLERLRKDGGTQHYPLLLLYQDLAVNYVDIAGKDLSSGNLEDAQTALRSLALILPELSPDTRQAAQQHYARLRRELKAAMARRR